MPKGWDVSFAIVRISTECGIALLTTVQDPGRMPMPVLAPQGVASAFRHCTYVCIAGITGTCMRRWRQTKRTSLLACGYGPPGQHKFVSYPGWSLWNPVGQAVKNRIHRHGTHSVSVRIHTLCHMLTTSIHRYGVHILDTVRRHVLSTCMLNIICHIILRVKRLYRRYETNFGSRLHLSECAKAEGRIGPGS